MKKIDYFDQNPKGRGWLRDLRLRPGELVQVAGVVYRYNVEREGREHTLTPVEK